MMAPNAFLVVLMSLLGGASGSHLLDYASTDLYWKSKGVVVSHEAMAAELKAANAQDIGKLIAQLGSPEAPVREAASKQILQLGPTVVSIGHGMTSAEDGHWSTFARWLWG